MEKGVIHNMLKAMSVGADVVNAGMNIAGSWRPGGAFGGRGSKSGIDWSRHDWQAGYDNYLNERAFNRALIGRQERAKYDFAKNSLTWQYEQAKKAGLDPSVVSGAPGYSPSAVQIGAGMPKGRPQMKDQNLTRAMRVQGFMKMYQDYVMTRALKDKTDAEAQLALSQARNLNAQTRKESQIPLTHMWYRQPNGKEILAPTPDYTASMLGRPLSNIGENVEEIYGWEGKESMRHRTKDPFRLSPRGKNIKLNVNYMHGKNYTPSMRGYRR